MVSTTPADGAAARLVHLLTAARSQPVIDEGVDPDIRLVLADRARLKRRLRWRDLGIGPAVQTGARRSSDAPAGPNLEVTATWDEIVSWQRGQIRVPLALDDGRDAVLVMDERTAEALVSQLQAAALGDGDGSRPAGASGWEPEGQRYEVVLGHPLWSNPTVYDEIDTLGGVSMIVGRAFAEIEADEIEGPVFTRRITTDFREERP